MSRRRAKPTDATAEFFDRLSARGHEPLLGRASGTVRFVRTNGRAAHWFLTITKGDVKVTRANTKADCVARGDRATWDGIVKGKTNATAAALRGALEVEGDRELLVFVQRLFPGPRRRKR